MGSNFSVAKDISDIKNKHLKKMLAYKKKKCWLCERSKPNRKCSSEVRMLPYSNSNSNKSNYTV